MNAAQQVQLVQNFIVTQTEADCRNIRWVKDDLYIGTVSCPWDIKHLKTHPAFKCVERIDKLDISFEIPLELLTSKYTDGYLCQQFFTDGSWGYQVTYLPNPNATPVLVAMGADKLSLESAQSACRMAIAVHAEKAVR